MTAQTRPWTARAGRFGPFRDSALSDATRGYLAYDVPALARSNLSGLTSRRPFTLLGILLALLVIAAFVLVAINASTGQGSTTQAVGVASKGLSPRIPIDGGALEVRSIAVAGYPTGGGFRRVEEGRRMVRLGRLGAGQPSE